MTTFKKFTGINNVLPSERLGAGELAMASNVDVGNDGELRRRKGYTNVSATAHANVWEAAGFTLATKANDLINVDTAAVLHAGIGMGRIRYLNLPDGRTAYSNGTVNGIVKADSRTTWGVPIPATLGIAADTAGALDPGSYQYSLTYVRTADKLEGAPAYAPPLQVALGGLVLTGLPALAGHTINVYLTSHNGSKAYLAGSTANTLFSFVGRNELLVLPCATDFLSPPPVGNVLGHWRGRALVAAGNALYASQVGQPELFDLARDYKLLEGDVTLIEPMEDGLYVGTDEELLFLAGTEFDKLKFTTAVDGAVVPGSGVAVDGEVVRIGEKFGQGACMLCIAGGVLVAGFNGGNVVRMTEGRYRTSATEVSAFVRVIDGMPQYVAVVQ